ncbi:MAG: UDP-N-acetylmuramoyl-L-alanyl-D-glutamate--2,6-diaminopimelate ligase [Rikenellaceae bacterium]|nr:UDP-N-acetylmuramoyl-L-alanyl-D-glutamate--2,6-diaminopimelate ligase [Rikenellaceae bacterium]
MKTLKYIIDGIKIQKIVGDINITIDNISNNSNNIKTNGLFIAKKGNRVDGHAYIDSAINNGAIAVLCSEDVNLPENITKIVVEDSIEAESFVAANFYDNPSKKLKIIGVTGTNGKTTTVTLIYQLLNNLGQKAGLISTIIYKYGNIELPAINTTPDAIELNKLMNDMYLAGCKYAVMEVSSHAIVQKRICGINFTGGIFTNITHEHLDYHGSFENYIKAKKTFFDNLPANAFALINLDDKNGKIMVQNTKAKIYTYGLSQMADFHARIIENTFQGLHLQIDGNDTWFLLLGRFNAYNILAAYSSAIILGFDKQEVLSQLSKIPPISGRFNIINNNDTYIIIDYAHTPDALENILSTINEMDINGKIITVFGAGGNRDKTKRPLMGQIAAQYSDIVIITSDNPRYEEPADIIADIEKGVPDSLNAKVFKIEDRADAIKMAINLANKGDVIVIAGKGHETYQEIKGIRKHFDDKEVVLQIINSKKIIN